MALAVSVSVAHMLVSVLTFGVVRLCPVGEHA